jgi:molybdate transport system substrate-binding protein
VAPYDKEGVFWIAVDPALYAPIRQGFVVMKTAASLPAVAAFAAFLSSPEARAIFASFGYRTP